MYHPAREERCTMYSIAFYIQDFSITRTDFCWLKMHVFGYIWWKKLTLLLQQSGNTNHQAKIECNWRKRWLGENCATLPKVLAFNFGKGEENFLDFHQNFRKIISIKLKFNDRKIGMPWFMGPSVFGKLTLFFKLPGPFLNIGNRWRYGSVCH